MSLFGRICITSWPIATRAILDDVLFNEFATIKIWFYARHDSNCLFVFVVVFLFFYLNVCLIKR